MAVLFVYFDIGNTQQQRINFGVAFLSGYLKRHGFQTDVCYYSDKNDENYCYQLLETGHFNTLAISSVTSCFPHAREFASRVKQRFPRTFIICGGPHVSIFPEELKIDSPFDAICLGFGEEPLLELLQSMEHGDIEYSIQNIYFNRGTHIETNPCRPFPADLDRFYPDDRLVFYREFRRKGLRKPFSPSTPEDFIFCRGCPFDCTFCSNHILKNLGRGKYVMHPTPKVCIDSIKTALELRKIQRISIHDDILTLNKNWFEEFIDLYNQEIKLPLICNLRIGTFDENNIALLKKAGCSVAILGIESGNEYIRNRILKKNLKTDDIIKGYRLLHDHGIRTRSQNMVGIPEEDFSKFYDTVRINAEILPNKPSISVYYPYPGTKLYERCVEDKLVKEEHLREVRSDFIERKGTLLNMEYFPREEIEFCAKYFRSMIGLEYIFTKLDLKDAFKRSFYSSKVLHLPLLILANAMLVCSRNVVRVWRSMFYALFS
jgi:radical SAM superfamily enzyme YgiQ (UPF0313 family)